VCSRKHCCHGNAISVTDFECVGLCPFYPARIAHAPYCFIICGSSDCTKDLSHCPIDGTVFRKLLLKVKCVTRFSLQNMLEKFHILRRILQDDITNTPVSSCKVPVITNVPVSSCKIPVIKNVHLSSCKAHITTNVYVFV
jgi:hypothetical protein